jgi:aspartyl-tRNA(Asn)/glutamyl-tRNA(Gln) amidotransferase subunit C
MAISPQDINKIARLSRLQVNESDIPALTERLGNILNMVDRMQSIDTTGVEPMGHPRDETQRLRADTVTETNQREQLQTVAPAVENGLFLVPKVIE